MRSAGVEKALICAWYGPGGALISNEEVLDATRSHPGPGCRMGCRVMTRRGSAWCRRPGACAGLALLFLGGAALGAQVAAPVIRPLRTQPAVTLAVTAGFRDWGPATLAGDTIIGTNMTGRGGVFAFDAVTGKPRWTWRGDGSGGVSVSAPVVVRGDTAVVLLKATYPNRLVGLSLATGRERWHVEVDVLREAELGAHEGLVFVQTTDGHLRAYDVQTGKAAWAFPFGGESGACGSRPIVTDGVAYLTGGLEAYVSAGAGARDRVWAIDATTGQEKWRHRAESASCADHPVVVTADGVFVTIDGDRKTYGLDRATGRRRWVQTITRTTDLERDYAVVGLVDAGEVIVGMTSLALVAFDPASGRVAWELPGRYRAQVPVLAAVGGVLYFQGSPEARPAPSTSGTLHALDLSTRALLWSFTRPTDEPDWPFGYLLPAGHGMWVDTYRTLLRLE
jgi:outer membrane protein assembly factor BamB